MKYREYKGNSPLSIRFTQSSGAIDQDGEVVEVYLQTKRDGAAAQRFLGAHAAVSNIFIWVGIWYVLNIIVISG